MGLQVEIRPVGDALELSPAPGEGKLDVGRPGRIMRQFFFAVMAKPQHVTGYPKAHVPLEALIAPILEPPLGIVGRDVVLELHLLELPRAENKVAGSDLVAERLADLSGAKRRLQVLGLKDVGKIDEMTLRSFRAQVGHRPVVLDRADEGLEHEVERPRVGEIRTPAVGTFELALFGRRQLVRPPALLAGAAVDERVGEILQVTRGFPDLRARQDGRVQADYFGAELDHRTPPCVFNVACHQHTEGAVVVGRAEPSVNLGGREHETPCLAQTDQFFHGNGHVERLVGPSPAAGTICGLDMARGYRHGIGLLAHDYQD